MDALNSRHLQWPRTAYIHGIDNVIFPPPAHPHPTLSNTRSRSTSPDSLLHTNSQVTHTAADKPWWQRLLIDAMLIPFTQGFMLTLAVNWVRYWRQTGGLMGLFRNKKRK